jgi:hypothetical protein
MYHGTGPFHCFTVSWRSGGTRSLRVDDAKPCRRDWDGCVLTGTINGIATREKLLQKQQQQHPSNRSINAGSFPSRSGSIRSKEKKDRQLTDDETFRSVRLSGSSSILCEAPVPVLPLHSAPPLRSPRNRVHNRR